MARPTIKVVGFWATAQTRLPASKMKIAKDNLRYPRKIEMMTDLLGSLFPNAEMNVLAYVPLNYNDEAEAREGEGNTGYRGVALFQVCIQMFVIARVKD